MWAARSDSHADVPVASLRCTASSGVSGSGRGPPRLGRRSLRRRPGKAAVGGGMEAATDRHDGGMSCLEVSI
jgi:hypothetical protein